MTADAQRPRQVAVANTLDGTTQLAGVVVQAGSVAGGIHHHTPSLALPVPRQLASVPAHFTGRENEAKALEAAREAGARLVVLSGIGGVGKSALATRWLHGYGHDQYSGGQFYADLQAPTGPVVPEAVLQQWLRALGVARPPAGLRELTGLWRSLTFDRTVALHLDNAADPAQVRPLLPSGAQSLTVVTSRASLWELGVDGASLHRIGPLDPLQQSTSWPASRARTVSRPNPTPPPGWPPRARITRCRSYWQAPAWRPARSARSRRSRTPSPATPPMPAPTTRIPPGWPSPMDLTRATQHWKPALNASTGAWAYSGLDSL